MKIKDANKELPEEGSTILIAQSDGFMYGPRLVYVERSLYSTAEKVDSHTTRFRETQEKISKDSKAYVSGNEGFNVLNFSSKYIEISDDLLKELAGEEA